jgi:RNA polymerase sigma-70 factor, ECF subfamily
MEIAILTIYQQLKRFVLSKVRNQQDAEDILQDVFIKARLKSTQLLDEGKINQWLYQITRNSIMDYYREKKKSIERDLVDTPENYNAFNDCVVDCLHELMKTLPSPYREALELADTQDVSQKELAKQLNISYSGLKSRVQRARQMLKDKMTELYNIQTDGYGNVLVCENREPCGCN